VGVHYMVSWLGVEIQTVAIDEGCGTNFFHNVTRACSELLVAHLGYDGPGLVVSSSWPIYGVLFFPRTRGKEKEMTNGRD
jgi:hypothetical protein